MKETTEQVLARLDRRAERVLNSHPNFSVLKLLRVTYRAVKLALRGEEARGRVEL